MTGETSLKGITNGLIYPCLLGHTALHSSQGLMVGILFCFLNGEVRTEMLRKWKRWRTKNIQFPPSTQMTMSHIKERTSISSDFESYNTAGVSSSPRYSSLTTPPIIPEGSQLLVKYDSNQNSIGQSSEKFTRTDDQQTALLS